MEQEFLIALGSNLGSEAGGRGETLTAAVAALAAAGVRVRRLSRFYATPCFPAGAGPDYVNACAAVSGPASWPDSGPVSGPDHSDSPASLLRILHRIEADFGRERLQRWASRSLDLDLLAAGHAVQPDPDTQTRWRTLPAQAQGRDAPDRLILPHPRMQDRVFVLLPLADIAADWRHPLTGDTVAQMLAALPRQDRAEARPI